MSAKKVRTNIMHMATTYQLKYSFKYCMLLTEAPNKRSMAEP